MYSFIARQPIFNNDLKTVAYELLFRDGMNNYFPEVSQEYATSKMISDQFLCIPLPNTLGNHISFINVPHRMIINGHSDALPVDDVVIEILEDAVPDNALFCAVKGMHARGYKIALDDFMLDSEWDKFLEYISVIKFDIRDKSGEEILEYINTKRHLLDGITFLAEKVESKEEFDFYSNAGFALFQGFFFSRPEILKSKCLSQNILSLSRLWVEVNREKFDFFTIEKILRNDLTLSYKIMRYVRNILFKTYGFVNSDSLTLKEILMYLGCNEIRRFVTVAALANMDGRGISELYHLSLVRGKFCELIASKVINISFSYKAFTCGLFSLLDVILEIPMEDLMKQISIPNDVTAALCEKKGELFDILNLSQCYEQLDWERTADICSKLNISEYVVIESMQNATAWASELSFS